MRRITFAVILGLVLVVCPWFSGCGALTAPGEQTVEKVVVKVEHDFGRRQPIAFGDRTVTFRPGHIRVTEDPPPNPDEQVSLIVDEDDFTIRVDPPAYPGCPHLDSPKDHHFELMLHMAQDGEDPCLSNIRVGPIEVTMRSGRATLAEAALPMHPKAAALARKGAFNVCAATWANFRGSVSVNKMFLEFIAKRAREDDFTELCHVPPGSPRNRRTITVGKRAVRRHLAHGDHLGPCDPPDEPPPDDPGDGKHQPNGCPEVVLVADAGPDLVVQQGETFTVTATAEIVQGEYTPLGLSFEWEQLSGPVLDVETDGPTLTGHTDGVEGLVLFQLTVSTRDASATATDELLVTINAPRLEQVAAGQWHNAARRQDGHLYTWGINRYGQLGNGSMTESVHDVDTGPTATLLALDDGTAFSMGTNALSDSAAPVQIGGVSNVVDVAALSTGGLLLDQSGTVWGFGDARNLQCELGGQPDPTAAGLLGPMPIPGLPTNIVSIDSGDEHGVAVDSDGVAWVWGSRFGCEVTPVLDDVAGVAAGQNTFCLFRRADGTAWGIGSNNFGQLGSGTTFSDFNNVVQVQGLTSVVHMAAGEAHSLFVTDDGTLWATGWNRYCQLGLEEEVSPATPLFGNLLTVPVEVGLGSVTAVAGGYTHSLALQEDGT
ncbi:MAG: hypothetical protein PVI86_15965, partial [Phycisphaerae bacterium]